MGEGCNDNLFHRHQSRQGQVSGTLCLPEGCRGMLLAMHVCCPDPRCIPWRMIKVCVTTRAKMIHPSRKILIGSGPGLVTRGQAPLARFLTHQATQIQETHPPTTPLGGSVGG